MRWPFYMGASHACLLCPGIVFHSEILHQKTPLVRNLLNRLGDRLPSAVARLGLNANQHRSFACLRRLQGGRELEAVRRNHAIIVVRGHNQRRRILGARLQVVQRRILVNRLELLRVIRRTVIRYPGPANCELVKAQHIQHADARQQPLRIDPDAAPCTHPPAIRRCCAR